MMNFIKNIIWKKNDTIKKIDGSEVNLSVRWDKQ